MPCLSCKRLSTCAARPHTAAHVRTLNSPQVQTRLPCTKLSQCQERRPAPASRPAREVSASVDELAAAAAALAMDVGPDPGEETVQETN
eukprot:6069342-Prymnesium_polylepis.1